MTQSPVLLAPHLDQLGATRYVREEALGRQGALLSAQTGAGAIYSRPMVRIILIALLALIAIVVLAVFLLRREPPRLPLDADHTTQRIESHCLSCHGMGERNARKPSHPNASDCFRCHSYKEAS